MTAARIFIGSSSEKGLRVAEDLRKRLRKRGRGELDPEIWNEGPFGLNEGYLESLTKAIRSFDFAILIATADDLVMSNEEPVFKARDNVIFELGLFMGKLGRARTFLVRTDEAKLRLPSDLSGVNVVSFSQKRVDDGDPDALKETCAELLAAIRDAEWDGGTFVLFPSLRHDPFYLDLLAGIAAPSSGTRDVTFLVPREAYSGQQFLDRLDELVAKQRGFKGGIIAPSLSGLDPQDVRERIARFSIPIVLVDVDPYNGVELPERVYYVGVDNRAGGRLAAACMREELGSVSRPRVLVLANRDQPERHDGFLEGHGGALRTQVVTCEFSAEAGRRTTAHALKHLGGQGPFHGIFAASDEIAFGALEAISDLPRAASNVVVVGFDGTPAARRMIDLQRTASGKPRRGFRNTVVQDAYELGERAMGLLKATLEAQPEPPGQRIVRPVRMYIEAPGPVEAVSS